MNKSRKMKSLNKFHIYRAKHFDVFPIEKQLLGYLNEK